MKEEFKRFCEKVKRPYIKLKKKVKSTPTYAKIERIGNKVANCILKALLAFFSVLAPVLTFLCIKTPDFDETGENEIR